MRKRPPTGFTLIEAVVCFALFAGLALGVASFFNQYYKGRSLARADEPIEQMEDAVRREVLNFMIQFFRNALVPNPAVCDLGVAQATTPFPGGLNRNLPIGLTFTHLDPARAEALKTAGDAPGVTRLNTALERCKTSSTQGIPNDYFRNRAGVYFCLQFTGAGAMNLAGMQPMVGEFFYTNLNPIAAVKNSEVACPALDAMWRSVPPVPTMGQLYYRLYWSSPHSSDRLFRSKSGLTVARSSP